MEFSLFCKDLPVYNPSYDFGMQSHFNLLMMFLPDPPPSIMKPLNVSVLPGQDALLQCVAFSTVEFNTTWYNAELGDRTLLPSRFTQFQNGSMAVR